jgi:hypothetical protein
LYRYSAGGDISKAASAAAADAALEDALSASADVAERALRWLTSRCLKVGPYKNNRNVNVNVDVYDDKTFDVSAATTDDDDEDAAVAATANACMLIHQLFRRVRADGVPPDPSYRRRLLAIVPTFVSDAVLAFPSAAGLLVGRAGEFLGLGVPSTAHAGLHSISGAGGHGADALRDEFALRFCWDVGEHFVIAAHAVGARASRRVTRRVGVAATRDRMLGKSAARGTEETRYQ